MHGPVVPPSHSPNLKKFVACVSGSHKSSSKPCYLAKTGTALGADTVGLAGLCLSHFCRRSPMLTASSEAQNEATPFNYEIVLFIVLTHSLIWQAQVVAVSK